MMRYVRCPLITGLLVSVIVASFVLFDDGRLPGPVPLGLIGVLCGLAATFVEEKLFL